MQPIQQVPSSEQIPADPPPLADAGLLVIHGVGAHVKTEVLSAIVNPLLARLTEERQLVDVAALSLGGEHDPGGVCDGLLVRYSTLPVPPGAPGANERRLLAVEGYWNDVFVKDGRERISAWVSRHAPRMMLELLRYHARGVMAVWALLVTSLLGLAIYTSQHAERWGPRPDDPRVPLTLAGLALMISVIVALVYDVRDALGRPRTFEGWLAILAAVATLVIYQVQRGLVLIVTAAGIVLLPLAAGLLRLLSSVPFLSGVAKGAFGAVEAALLTGGIADMEAVADNHVTAAAIRTRLRQALMLVESRVAAGGSITLVAHSGGAPPAWRILSEPQIIERQAAKRFRYRLITVGAALNWALRGFDNRATPLGEPLVNADCPDTDDRTFWLNVYAPWDPVPHGPAPATEFFGWETWDSDPPRPNRLVRNLGAPVPSEHNEYWRNQQEFVPLLMRSIDPHIAWAERDAGSDAQLWSNLRLALLSVLVRTRLAVLAVPVAATVAMLRGVRFISCEPGTGYRSRLTTLLGKVIESAVSGVIGTDGYAAVRDAVCASPLLIGALLVAALALIAYALMDIYTNVIWQSLGRATASLRPITQPPPLVAVPLRQTLLVWLPAMLGPPLLLAPFHLGRGAWQLLTVANVVIALFEIVWLNTCLRAFRDDALRRVAAVPVGRGRPSVQRQAPAGKAALPG